MYKIKVIILQLISSFLKLFQYSPRKLISKSDQKSLLNRINPINNGFELIRIGGTGDGSYLVPNDLENIGCLISPGVGISRKFEDDIFNRFGINAILVDPFASPCHLNEKDLYIDSLVTATKSLTSITLEDLVKMSPPGDLILQMDIESGEYEALFSTSELTLRRFRIIIVEFHRIDYWLDKIQYELLVKPLLEKLLSIFDVVHIHPNTSTGYFEYNEVKFPKFAEFTFHRKDRSKGMEGFRSIPQPLDTLTNKSDKDVKWYFTR